MLAIRPPFRIENISKYRLISTKWQSQYLWAISQLLCLPRYLNKSSLKKKIILLNRLKHELWHKSNASTQVKIFVLINWEIKSTVPLLHISLKCRLKRIGNAEQFKNSLVLFKVVFCLLLNFPESVFITSWRDKPAYYSYQKYRWINTVQYMNFKI